VATNQWLMFYVSLVVTAGANLVVKAAIKNVILFMWQFVVKGYAQVVVETATFVWYNC
jgi:hypothetical protein